MQSTKILEYFEINTLNAGVYFILLNRSVVAILVDVQGVSSRAMLLTDRALKTGGLQVFGFHVHMYN